MNKLNGESNDVLLPLSAAYLGVGLILLVVGYGLKPLLVAGGSLLLLRCVLRNIEEHGDPVATE